MICIHESYSCRDSVNKHGHQFEDWGGGFHLAERMPLPSACLPTPHRFRMVLSNTMWDANGIPISISLSGVSRASLYPLGL